MGSIRQRVSKTGVITYYAEVRVHDGKEVLAREAATFKTKREAVQWVRRVEGRWQDKTPLRHAQGEDLTVGQVVERYANRLEPIRPWSAKRKQQLRAFLKRDLAGIPAHQLTVADVVDFAAERKAGGAGPATVILDFGMVANAFKEARSFLGLPVDDAVFRQARPLLMKLGLIAKPKTRSRRPEKNELDRLLSALRLRQAHQSALLPMVDMVEFLIYSCLRLSEMTGLLWEDVDADARTVVVRNRKHPSLKEGNHQVVPLLGPAWEVLDRQPRLAARVFPFEARSISAAFTRTRQQLEITDLHLHDLRRHGISRLLERGFSPSEVAAVSGHRDISILHKIYTKIMPEHLHTKYEEKS